MFDEEINDVIWKKARSIFIMCLSSPMSLRHFGVLNEINKSSLHAAIKLLDLLISGRAISNEAETLTFENIDAWRAYESFKTKAPINTVDKMDSIRASLTDLLREPINHEIIDGHEKEISDWIFEGFLRNKR